MLRSSDNVETVDLDEMIGVPDQSFIGDHRRQGKALLERPHPAVTFIGGKYTCQGQGRLDDKDDGVEQAIASVIYNIVTDRSQSFDDPVAALLKMCV